MSSLRALEQRLRAWRGFRDVAHATRSLAAVQQLRWAGEQRRAREHLDWVEALRQREPDRRPLGPRLVVGVGTDLGLCGRLNQEVAAALTRALDESVPARCVVVVGQRLADALPEQFPCQLEPSPASLPALLALAGRLEALATSVSGPGRAPGLRLVLATGLTPGGRPRISVQDDSDWAGGEHALHARQAAGLSRAGDLAAGAAGLQLHARLVEGICRASWCEAALRLAAMSRAHEEAGRRIAEQEQHLRRASQEQVTQEMLEVTRNSRRG